MLKWKTFSKHAYEFDCQSKDLDVNLGIRCEDERLSVSHSWNKAWTLSNLLSNSVMAQLKCGWRLIGYLIIFLEDFRRLVNFTPWLQLKRKKCSQHWIYAPLFLKKMKHLVCGYWQKHFKFSSAPSWLYECNFIIHNARTSFVSTQDI